MTKSTVYTLHHAKQGATRTTCGRPFTGVVTHTPHLAIVDCENCKRVIRRFRRVEPGWGG